jgi:hypothetical protein
LIGNPLGFTDEDLVIVEEQNAVRRRFGRGSRNSQYGDKRRHWDTELRHNRPAIGGNSWPVKTKAALAFRDETAHLLHGEWLIELGANEVVAR